MTRKRSSPMGLEIYLPVLLAFIMLPLLAQAAPLQDYTEIQQYTEGCYYNYNHYNEGDRIMTNEPCLNCTCHNKMLMCYLRVCPFTKPIGHDCIVEKREDQCCPIITCPEVPVDVAHSSSEPGTELSFPEKFGCSIDGKFYLEGAQVPSNPNKPCELCYCIKNRTSCLMQECTLHIDGCTPIYNRGSCCPVRYNCDHENDVLELEDHSTTTEAATSTTTTERPTTGFIIASTMSPSVSTDCMHNGELYADGARILGETACENCYCMRGDIICAVQECQMPMLNSNGKSCHALPAAEGECCPSNYVCEDDSSTTQIIEATTLPYGGLDAEVKVTTAAPVKDLHSGIPEEDLQLQTHIDEEETATKMPAADSKTEEEIEKETAEEESEATTVAPAADITDRVTQAPSTADKLPEIATASAEDEVKTEASHAEVSEAPAHEDKDQQVGEIKPSAEEEEEEKPITTVPISELPEISTDAIASGEEADTEISATGKPEIVDSVTEIPTADNVEVQQVPEVSTDSTEEEEEAKPIAGDEYATSAPVSDEELASTKTPLDGEEGEHKLEESHEDITKGPFTTEHTTGIFEESSTKAPVAIGEQESEHITETPEESAEKEQETSTKISSEETVELSTPTAPTTASAEEEKEPQSIVTEEDSDSVTEIAPGKLSPEGEEDIPTERPEKQEVKQDEKEGEEAEHETVTEKDIHETTQSDDESKPLSSDEVSTSMPTIETEKEPASTDMSTEAEESGIATKAPTSEDEEQESVTSLPHVEQEEKDEETSDYVPTKVPTLESSESTEEDVKGPADISEENKDEEGSGEGKPIADDDQEIDRITKVPQEEHTATPAVDEDKHILADELGSGDHTTEVSIGHEEASQPSIVVSTEGVTSIPETQDKEEVQVTLDESVDDKLPESETPTTSTETSEESAESEEDTKLMDLTTAKPSAEHIDVTTIKPSTKIDITTSATEPSEESTEKEIEFSTIQPIADKVESEEEQATGKPVTIGEQLPTGEITDKVETEEATTQKSIEESVQQTTAAPTDDIAIETEEETKDKIIPESDDHTDELPTGTTDSPMVIAGEETDKKHDAESTTSASKHEEEAESTTTKPHVEPALIEETPDMQLPSVIPGEGDCLVGQKTYHNNSIIPTSDECEIVCKCVSSIVSCERVECEVPENIEKCILDESSTNKCCPSYICATDSLPPKGSIDSIESTEQDEDEIPYTTIAAPHKLPEHPTVVEETEEEKSEISTIKPSVAAEDVSPAISIPEIEMPIASTEEPMSHVKHEDEDFETHVTKAPVDVIAEDKKDTYPEAEEHTTPPAVIEDIIVPQSMAPVQVTDQEQQHTVTDKQPTDTAEKETEPEISVGQQEPETEKETEPAISVGQQEPETALHEETTAASVESVTDSTSAPSIPSADEYQTVKPTEEEKEEEEEETSGELIDYTGRPIVIEDLDAITPTSEEDSKPQTETLAPSAPSETETAVHVPSDEKESQPETEAEIPTSTATSSTDEKTEDHTVVASVPSEEDKLSEIPEDHTASTEEEDKETSQEAEIHTPAPSDLEKDTPTVEPLDTSEAHTLAPSSEVVSEHTVAPALDELEETSEEIEMATSVPIKDADKEEQQPSSTESLEDISSVPSKVHDTGNEEEDITRTTAIPSIDDTKDHGITSDHTVVPSLAEDESTSTITPVSEEGKEPSDVSEISSSSTTAPTLDEDKDEHSIAPASEESEEDVSATTASIISPVGTEDQDHVTDAIEYSTIIPGTEDKIDENFTPLEGESLEHTVAPAIHDEVKESSEETIDESSTTVAPVSEVDENKSEVQTAAPISTDHTIAPTTQESVEETEKEDISTETLDIATHKPIDIETKIDTSSQVPSSDDVQTHIPPQENIDEDVATATVIPEEEKEEVFEDHTQASSTDNYEGEQTESTFVDQKQQPTPGSTTEESESVASVDNVTVPSEEEHKQQPTLAPATEESESVASVDNIDVSSEEEEGGEQEEKENITIPSIVEDKKELEEAMAHTVAPSIQEEEENVSKHPVAADDHKPEDDMEHVTKEPSVPSAITEETSTSAVPVEKDEADEQKPVSSAEEHTTAQPSIETESTHAPSKQPSLDLFEEASGESEESEEEISTEPTKIQHIGEFVTERVDEATVKPIDTAVDSEEEKEASGVEDETLSSTEKPYQPTVADDQSVIKPDDVSTISTDKLPEEEITSAVTKAPEDITDEDTTAQQAQEEIIPSVGDHDTDDTTAHVPTEQDSLVPSVTKAPLAEQDIEETSSQQPEEPESVTKTSPTAEDIDHVTDHDLEGEVEEVAVKLDTTEQPGIEGTSSEHPGIEDKEYATKAPTAAEAVEDIRVGEENIPSVTKSPISVEYTTAQQLEDENTVAVTKVPVTAEKVDIVTDKKPEEEKENEDMEYTTSSSAEAEEGDNVASVTKAPVAADEIENVTAEEEEEIVSPVAQSTAAPEEAVSVTAHADEIPETMELTTIKSATAEDAGKIEEHVSEVVPEADIEIATAKPQASESTEETKPSEESEETGETLDTTKVPETSEETGTTVKLPTAQMVDELPDEEEEEGLVETSSAKLPETSEHITETSTKITEPEETKEGSQEESTELPAVAHISTESSIKDTESESESTESPLDIQKEPVDHDTTDEPTKTAESEEDESTEAHISTDILPEEESHENTTDLSAIGPVSTGKLPEHVTEAVSADVDAEGIKETAAETTEVPLEGEKYPEIMDHVTDLPTKHVGSEEVEEESPEQVTHLPVEGHVTADELPEHITESEEEEESTELPKETHVSSDELPEHSTTTLPTKITEPEEEEKETHEESSELPTGGEASTSKLPEVFEHVTELPVESHEPEVAEHVTELPSDSVETEDDDEEKKTHDESSVLPESPEQVTKLPVKDTKSETTESTDKLSEIPQEHIAESEEEEEKEESPKLPVDVSVSTDKLLEPVTELPTKEMETEEESHEVPVEGQEVPSNDIQTEDEVTETPVESHVAHELDAHVTELPTKDVESEEDVHETATELPVVVVAHDVSTQGQAVEQSTETASKEEESHEETTSSETAEEISDDGLLPTTTTHPLFQHLATTLPTVPIDGRIDDTNQTFTAHSTASPAPSTTTSTTTSEPTTTSASQHYQPQPPVYGQPPQYGPTQYEDEYTDEDEGEVFGPGTCRYGGKLYVSAQQIPRDDPCDFCFCFRSDIICLQQSCPPPIAGCHEEPISGFCCPRYECPVSMATVLNITTSTTTTSTTLPPHFLHHSYGNNVQRNGCLINGRSYRVGEKIESTSGPCINCTCGGDGKMKCDPQACVPEPTMQQVMAVVAAGRKR